MRLLPFQKKPNASELVKRLGLGLDEEFRDRLRNLVSDLEEPNEDCGKRAHEEIDSLIILARARQALKEIASGQTRGHAATAAQEIIRCQVSTLFLRECLEYLPSDPDNRERLALITGSVTADGLRILSRMVKVPLEQQSAAYVCADERKAHYAIVSLTEHHGHQLLAMFHSHMGDGPEITKPSSTDIANQERFVKLGCDAIGGIFSLDGYVRLFSTWKPFELDVYGNGAETLLDEPMEKLFRVFDVGEEL